MRLTLESSAAFPLPLLCSGKTTLLRYLLENSTENVACIVNDVASINIDAKLVRNDRNRNRSEQVNTTSDLADTIELANGCACEQLGSSFAYLLLI
jgi:G3E family GTPase